jgi:hypothetical protein
MTSKGEVAEIILIKERIRVIEDRNEEFKFKEYWERHPFRLQQVKDHQSFMSTLASIEKDECSERILLGRRLGVMADRYDLDCLPDAWYEIYFTPIETESAEQFIEALNAIEVAYGYE